jgi:predicted aspartyl protease
VVEIEGMVTNHIISILIDHGYNLSYISPQIVDKCKLQQAKHAKLWLVQLANGTKRKVTKVIKSCQITMNGFPTKSTLKGLPLLSYEMLIGMDWLESHKSRLDHYNKTLECEDDKGKKKTLQGIKKNVLVRQISTLQMKKYCKNGFSLYEIQVFNSVEGQKPILENHPILKDDGDVFLEEVPVLPLRRDIKFSLELVPEAMPMSREPFMMSTLT